MILVVASQPPANAGSQKRYMTGLFDKSLLKLSPNKKASPQPMIVGDPLEIIRI